MNGSDILEQAISVDWAFVRGPRAKQRFVCNIYTPKWLRCIWGSFSWTLSTAVILFFVKWIVNAILYIYGVDKL